MKELDEKPYTAFGKRVQLAKRHAGIESDAELAERVAHLVPPAKRAKIDARFMQRTKTSEGSVYAPAIAEACGVRCVWLAYGIGEMTTSTTLVPEQRQLLEAYAHLPPPWRRLLGEAIHLAAATATDAPVRNHRPRVALAASALPPRSRRKGKRSR